MDLYNPSELANKKLTLLKRTKNHSGPVRGLHFNPTDHHLLASGSTDGEILIWDMNQLDTPYAPGERSGRLEEVTYLGWNKDVPHILASGSSNGYTVLWDLRNRKEIIKIANPGGRRPITSIQWNPSKATQMVTSSDDDVNPVILVWDLRNASASEKTMSGHQKGILAMDWCPKDSDLLLSSGKDNRTIVWDTESGEPIGDLNHSSNWSFDCRWYPRNPDLCVVASFDGNIMVHSIQGTGHTQDPFTPVPHHEVLENHDPFSSNTVQEHLHEIQQPEFSLIKPPKWLRKHVGASWGFGSSLVMFDQNSSHITIKNIPVNDEIAFRTDQLEFILNENNPETSMEYCDYMAQSEFVDENDKDVWRFMKTLFSSNRKEDLMTFFGDKQDDPRLAKLMNKLTMENSSPAKGSSPGIAHASPQMIEDKGPFQLYSSKVTEDNDVDTLITKSLIVGDFETAVQVCIGSNRMADALAIAFTGGHELMVQTQKEFLKRASKTKSYSRVLQGIVTGELEDLIKSCRLDGKDAWKDILGIICVHANVESLDYYFKILGDKLSQLPGPKNQHFASLCYMGSHNFQSVSKSWFSHSVHDGVENIKVQAMIEKISVFRQAIGFQDPGLSLEFIPGEQFPLNDLYEAYVEYAWIAENHGKVDVAWRFLEQVPVDFIPKHASDNIFVLRDRVYSNKGYPLAVTGGMPSFPYERVDVIDFESKRLAEEQRIQQEQFQHEQERKKSFQQEPFQLQQERKKSLQSQSQNQFQQYPSAHPANQYQQPSVNQYQPVVNQWTPQPPANPWAPPPSNQWAPPRTSAVAPPPVSTGHTSNAPVPHYQPPSHFMPATNQPSQPQFPRRDSYASPNVSHASAPTANYNEGVNY
jgi:protein transport protein SEC31